MRLRRVPGTREKLLRTGDILVKEPFTWRSRWQQFFGSQAPLFLEIGCGRGRFITAAARLDPAHHYIGLELREEMVDTAIERLKGETPQNLCFVWQDAALLTEIFAPGEVARIFLNFSDPWPKRRHRKRRLTHGNFLAQYAQILEPGGKLILKTDNKDFFEFSLTELSTCGWRLVEVDREYHLKDDPDNIATEYEIKFRRQGTPIHRLCAVYHPDDSISDFMKKKESSAMKYISTRGNSLPVSAGAAIKNGMVPGGGLYVPQSIPAFPYTWKELSVMDYRKLATEIFKLYLTDFTAEAIQQMVEASYHEKSFSHPLVAPLVCLPNGLNILELWHGPTAAFKDMALQVLPRLLTYAVAQEEARPETGPGPKAESQPKTAPKTETVILVATSGDTGKAALEGFKNVPGVQVIVFYPDGGVSPMQRLQMCTTDGDNTHVVAVRGNFDHCQSAVKAIFNDISVNARLAQAGKGFSSANSINWGRLLPQIVYYFYAYGQMLAQGKVQDGELVNITVPTGNFGNILAAYYAREMGLPVRRLICASNKNKILSDVLSTGVYDCHREFYKTTSPSMDILISSNFERFFYAMADGDSRLVAAAFTALAKEGRFDAPQTVVQKWQSFMSGGYAEEEAVLATIEQVFRQTGYTVDPHTAVAVRVYEDYAAATSDDTPNIITSTASPFKFCRSVLLALTSREPESGDEDALLQELAKLTGLPVHPALAGLNQKSCRHHSVVEIAEMPQVVLNLLGLSK